MAIIHTPRTIVSIARGLLRRRQKLAANASLSSSKASDQEVAFPFVGLVPTDSSSFESNHHIYKSRPNILWDADYLGHMNNASYLTHAEYARWEWTAENGLLGAMYQNRASFVVTNTALRFRREILPRQAFEIHSFLRAIDERNIWIHQTFRGATDDNNSGKKGRILAQVLVQAVIVQNRKVIPPSNMLSWVGVPKEMADALVWKETIANSEDDDDDDAAATNNNNSMSLLKQFKNLDEAFRKEASLDDERLVSSKEK